MGLNLLGDKKTRRIARAAGTDVDQAVVNSHHKFHLWWFVTPDHRHGRFDTRTEHVDWLPRDPDNCTSSCDKYPDRQELRDIAMKRIAKEHREIIDDWLAGKQPHFRPICRCHENFTPDDDIAQAKRRVRARNALRKLQQAADSDNRA